MRRLGADLTSTQIESRGCTVLKAQGGMTVLAAQRERQVGMSGVGARTPGIVSRTGGTSRQLARLLRVDQLSC